VRGFIALLLAAGMAAPAAAQSEDVTFFVIGKHANFDQKASGSPKPRDFSFFSEIFLIRDGDASQANLVFPTGETQPFRDMRQAEAGDRDNLLLVSGEDRFSRADDLKARYPDGDYRLSFRASSGDIDATLTFQPRPLPAAPQIYVRQGGRRCLTPDPGEDTVVSWSPFAEGRADPNGILDDLVFVIVTNDEGVRVAHSGRPFERRPYLTFADTAFTIKSGVLKAGRDYTLSVEHALLDDTTEFDGVPGFTTRAVTTNLPLRTARDGDGGCRE